MELDSNKQTITKIKGFKKGCIPWNKGKTLPKDVCIKISSSLKEQWKSGKRKGGWKLSEEAKRKVSAFHKGRYRNSIKCSCLYCNLQFQRPKSLVNGRVFCSKKCNSLWMKFVRKTEDHPLYRGIGNKNAKLYRQKSKINNPNHYKVRRESAVVYRLRRRGLGGNITKKEWLDIKEKSEFTCRMCGRKEPEIKLVADHIIPVTKWQEWIRTNFVNYKCGDKENIQALCISCNCKKSNKIIYEPGYKSYPQVN